MWETEQMTHFLPKNKEERNPIARVKRHFNPMQSMNLISNWIKL